MSPLPFNSDKFKKLKNEWYEKLKNEGFKDIETEYGDLRQYASNNWRGREGLLKQKLYPEYYEMVSNFMNQYRFDNFIDRMIMEMHASGLSIRKIAKNLKEFEVKKMSKSKIHLRIKNFVSIMQKNK